MVKIQIDLDADTDHAVEVFKVVNRLKNKEDAIIKMLASYKFKIIQSRRRGGE